MKIKLDIRMVRLAMASGLVVLGSCLTNHLQAQLNPSDPANGGPAWDLAVSGQARGVAQIVFNANGTLSGQVHLETRKKVKGGSADFDDRGGINPEDRGGSTGTNSSSSSSITNIFGSFGIDGQWGFDPATQRIVGYLNEGGVQITSTSTNVTTNSVSFRGVVRGGSKPRLTLKGTSSLGSQVLQGVPLQSLPDISGPYAAVGKRGGKSVVEFFTLSSLGANNYSVTGGGPSYAFDGFAILSAMKRLSITTEEQGTNRVNLTMAVGTFKTNYVGTSKSLGSLNGRDTDGPVSLKILNQ